MAYQIKWQDNIVFLHFSGQISNDEIVAANTAWYSNSKIDMTKCVICNFMDADLSLISRREVEGSVATDKGASISSPGIKIAFVTEHYYVQGLCEHYINLSKKLCSSWCFSIFKSVDDALEWGVN